MSNNRKLHNLGRAGSIALLSGCLWFSATPVMLGQDAPAAQASQNDTDLQSKVSSALSQDSTLQGQQITANVAQGQVTLTGSVQTNAQRQRAETVAVNTPGVSGILNNLNVSDPNSPIPVAQSNGSEQQDANTVQQQTDQQNAADAQAPPPPPDQTQAAPQQPAYSAQAPAPGYNGARPQYQPYQQQYAQAPPPPPSGPVTIPAGTLLRVRLSEPIDTAHVKSGTFFQATAAADVYQGGVLAIPRGATLTGQVVEAKDGGRLGGSAVLRLNLTGVNLEGRTYTVATDEWSNKGPNKAGYTAANTVGGAALGAIIGGIVGRGAGAAIGAGVGGAAGLGASAATNGPRLVLPTETQVDFHLMTPVTVQPVSWQEAQRLAATSAPQQQPQLVRRSYYPYVRPYGYPPPPPPGYAPYPY